MIMNFIYQNELRDSQIPVCRVDALALKNCNLGNRHLLYLPIRAMGQFNVGIGSTYPF